MISQGHVIKGSSNFMEGGSSLNVTTLPGLVAMGIVVMMFLIYHVASHDLVLKGLCNFVGGSFSQ